MGESVSVYVESSEELEVDCPLCGGKAVLREATYDLPNVGRALLASLTCTRCGYRRADLVPLHTYRRRRIYYTVSDPEDLNARVLRSSVATVEIPELGVSITPGAGAHFIVTNVEGILRLVQDAAKSIEVLGEGSTGFVDTIERLISRGGRFTLIIDDPWGVSFVEPPKEARACKVLLEEVEAG
ncbi:MAG: ZPR1 zinc finger domain-containing protein [Thermofilaceae archaeon]